MYLYTVIEAMAAVVAGILIAVFTGKADGVVHGKLDKIWVWTRRRLPRSLLREERFYKRSLKNDGQKAKEIC